MDFSFRNLKKFVSENFLFDEGNISNETNSHNENNIFNTVNEKEVLKVYIHIYIYLSD